MTANCLHSQGLKGRPQKNLEFLCRNLDHPKDDLLLHTKIIEMGGMRFRARLSLKIGKIGR